MIYIYIYYIINIYILPWSISGEFIFPTIKIYQHKTHRTPTTEVFKQLKNVEPTQVTVSHDLTCLHHPGPRYHSPGKVPHRALVEGHWSQVIIHDLKNAVNLRKIQLIWLLHRDPYNGLSKNVKINNPQFNCWSLSFPTNPLNNQGFIWLVVVPQPI